MNNFLKTEEHEKIFNRLKLGENLIINSVAGSGKTTTMQQYFKRYSNLYGKGIIFSFNRNVAEDNRKELPSNIQAKTFHGKAYEDIISAHNRHLKTWNKGLEKSQYIKKRYIDIKFSIYDFQNISDKDIEDYWKFVKTPDIYPETAFIFELLNDMEQGYRGFSFDMLVKYYQLMLKEKQIIGSYDIVVIDEAQDTYPVTWQIAKSLVKPDGQLVYIGDTLQNIYEEYTGTINIMEKSSLPTLYLTKSYRVSNEYAPSIQNFVNRNYENLRENFVFRGIDRTGNEEVVTTCYLSMSNLQAIKTIDFLIGYRISCSTSNNIIQKITDALWVYTNLKKAGIDIQWCLDNEDRCKFYEALKTNRAFGRDKLNKIKKWVYDNKDCTSTIVQTVHTSKGQTFDEVILNSDLNEALESINEDISECYLNHIDNEDMLKRYIKHKDYIIRILYVASTRAKYRLRGDLTFLKLGFVD